jgi:hypothetical protein
MEFCEYFVKQTSDMVTRSYVVLTFFYIDMR